MEILERRKRGRAMNSVYKLYPNLWMAPKTHAWGRFCAAQPRLSDLNRNFCYCTQGEWNLKFE
jgi:hypothetical protein